MRVSELLSCMGAGWRPVLELVTGGASYGPFPTAAHAETFVYTKECAAEDSYLPHRCHVVDIDVMAGIMLVITWEWGN